MTQLPAVLEPEVTPKEIAAATRLHYRTILRYIESGELEAFQYGAAYRVPLSAFEAFREKHRVRPTTRRRSSKASAGSVTPLPRREDGPGSVSSLRALEERGAS